MNSSLQFSFCYVPSVTRPENWLVRQLNDGAKAGIKWDLLERKERLQLEKFSRTRKPVARCTDEDWGFYGRFNPGLGGFLIGLAFPGLSQVNWFGLHLYWGRGNNLESILLISPVADLYLSFRMQECRPPSPQVVEMISPSMGDGILTHLP
jgi:hypothetical protein